MDKRNRCIIGGYWVEARKEGEKFLALGETGQWIADLIHPYTISIVNNDEATNTDYEAAQKFMLSQLAKDIKEGKGYAFKVLYRLYDVVENYCDKDSSNTLDFDLISYVSTRDIDNVNYFLEKFYERFPNWLKENNELIIFSYQI